MTIGGRAARVGAVLTLALVLTVVTAGRASAQPRFSLVVRPEIVTSGTPCEAEVTGSRPGTVLRLFASVTTGTNSVGPFATECGDDARFNLLLGGTVKHIRAADAVADSNGAATLLFRLPPRLPPRYNGVKVYFQCGGALSVPDGSGGCTTRTATSNVDCSTVQLDLR